MQYFQFNIFALNYRINREITNFTEKLKKSHKFATTIRRFRAIDDPNSGCESSEAQTRWKLACLSRLLGGGGRETQYHNKQTL